MSELAKILSFYRSNPCDNYVLATLVSRRGASYRQPGARMLIGARGDFAGCISGGCLEQEVVVASRSVFESGTSTLLTFDTRPHFGCGGEITLHLERIASPTEQEPHLLQAISEHLERRVSFLLKTVFRGGGLGTHLISENAITDSTDENTFFQYVSPQPRLVVIGAGLDSVPLCDIAEKLSWDIYQVVEPGAPYRMSKQLTRYTVEYLPDEIATQFKPDPWTAVVIMNHHYTRDLRYLAGVIQAGYPYVGLLGATHRREALLADLEPHGIFENPDCLDCLYGPIGLNIGAREPESIALSILGEIQAVWSKRSGGFLREHVGQIHGRSVADFAGGDA